MRQRPIPGTGDALFGAEDAQIELGAAQGGDADAVALGSGLDVVLGARALEQVLAQPFGYEFAPG